MSTLSLQQDSVSAIIAENHQKLVELRRHLHANPELSHEEYKTTALLAEKLKALGYDVHVRPEGLGLYADLTPKWFSPEVHPTIAIRADMDALPIIEQNDDIDYKSTHDGVMHACGHDVHMTCTMGACLAFPKIIDELPGRIRIVYQHAEESSPSGASDMVDFGAVEGVDAIIALHCDPERPVGTVGVRAGALTAAFDRFIFTIIGKGGHGARPHHCVDPIFVGTQMAQTFYQITTRQFDAREAMVFSIGSFQAGDVPNVIPETATLSGTVRTLSNARRAEVEPMLNRVAQNICDYTGARYELDLYRGAPAIINNAQIVDIMAAVARDLLGQEHVQPIELPSMGSEDFSQYLQHVPGAMFRLGTARADRPIHRLHSSLFNIDERAIGHGANILSRTAIALLHKLKHHPDYLNH